MQDKLRFVTRSGCKWSRDRRPDSKASSTIGPHRALPAVVGRASIVCVLDELL